jgi:cytochrome c553
MRRLMLGLLATAMATAAGASDDTARAASTPVSTTARASGKATAAADYSFCTVCHGAHGNGNPAINAPKIAGIEPWYLKRQLELFRAGSRGTQPSDRPGTEMRAIGQPLDDVAIEAIAAYVATFDARPPPVTVTGNAKRGRSLYTSCSGCHGPRGEGNSALNAPALAGQTDWYLVTQIERFRAGERGFAPEDVFGNQMRAAAAMLPDTGAVNDVVAYINTLAARRRG